MEIKTFNVLEITNRTKTSLQVLLQTSDYVEFCEFLKIHECQTLAFN